MKNLSIITLFASFGGSVLSAPYAAKCVKPATEDVAAPAKMPSYGYKAGAAAPAAVAPAKAYPGSGAAAAPSYPGAGAAAPGKVYYGAKDAVAPASGDGYYGKKGGVSGGKKGGKKVSTVTVDATATVTDVVTATAAPATTTTTADATVATTTTTADVTTTTTTTCAAVQTFAYTGPTIAGADAAAVSSTLAVSTCITRIQTVTLSAFISNDGVATPETFDIILTGPVQNPAPTTAATNPIVVSLITAGAFNATPDPITVRDWAPIFFDAALAADDDTNARYQGVGSLNDFILNNPNGLWLLDITAATAGSFSINSWELVVTALV